MSQVHGSWPNDPVQEVKEQVIQPTFIVAKGSDTSAILQAIAALAANQTAKDRLLAALSEQIRLGFERLENCSSADWFQTRTLLDLINKQLFAIEQSSTILNARAMRLEGMMERQLQHNQQHKSKRPAKKRKR